MPMRRSRIRRAVTAAATNHRIAEAMTRAEPIRLIAEDYVAGETLTDAVATALDRVDKGLEVTLHPLSTEIADPRAAEDTTGSLIGAVEELGSWPELEGHAEVSINLTSLGLRLPGGGPRAALEHAEAVCRAARNHGVLVTVEDEGPEVHPETFEIVTSLLADFPDTGVVVQAARHDSLDQIRELAAPGRRIRLCKGAYSGPAREMVTRPHDVDLRMASCLRALLQSPATAMIATHDPVFVAIAERLIADLGRGPDDTEFQMLQGIRPLEQRRLADIGLKVRVYLPWGREWYRYCARQLLDRPANLWLFSRSLVVHR
jgi:proline dehydrogenase